MVNKNGHYRIAILNTIAKSNHPNTLYTGNHTLSAMPAPLVLTLAGELALQDPLAAH